MGHDHGRGGHGHGRAADRRLLSFVLALDALVVVVELLGAWFAHSLALLADAGHIATDAASILLTLGASYLAARPAGPRSTFGYHRAEVLAAAVNALVLLGLCGYLVYAAVDRLIHPGTVSGGPMIAFAAGGAVANAVALVLLQNSSGSLGMKAAATEVLSDTLGSALAVVAGIVVAVSGWHRADPIASLLIAVLVLPRSITLLREAASVLLEIAPRGLSLDEVRSELMSIEGVTDVHDLHAWTITSGLPSLSAHVTVADVCLANHGAGAVLDQLCHRVAERFEVRHATFQLEPASHRAHEDLGDVH